MNYAALITKVASEVAREFEARAGKRGHGYEVATADDIEQRVHLQLLEGGYDDAYFDSLDEPQASIRLFARNAAYREVEARLRKDDGRGQGHRENTMDLRLGQDESKDQGTGAAVLRAHPSTVGLPLDEMLRVELESRLHALAEDLLSKVPEAYRTIFARYYLDGEDIGAISGAAKRTAAYEASGKKLQRGRKSIHPDEEASLRALRAYWHPHAKTPGRIKATGTATALLDILAT